jgi:thioredoxin reductase
MSETNRDDRVTDVAGVPDGLDVLVVGGGAAGLNAALMLARARRRVAVVDAGAPRNGSATRVGGFLTRDGMSPAALLAAGREELAGYGVPVLRGRVTGVERTDDGGGPARFRARMADGTVLAARRLLVATGLRDELPDLPGVRERWGRDVLHCPYCHGYEVRDQPLGVLGTGPHSVAQALMLPQWSDDVVFFPHLVEPTAEERERLAARGVRLMEGPVGRLAVAGGRLRGVEMADGRAVPLRAVFVSPRPVPQDGLLTALGCARGDDGRIRADALGRTDVPGVWTAGNVADPHGKLVNAAGAGATAAVAVDRDLAEEDTADAVRRYRAAAATAAAPQIA